MNIIKFLASEDGANAAKWAVNSVVNDAHKALKAIKDLDGKDSMSKVQRILLGLAVCDFSESIESIQNLLNVKDEILYKNLTKTSVLFEQEAEKPKDDRFLSPATPVVGWINPSHKFDWTGKSKNEDIKPF